MSIRFRAVVLVLLAALFAGRPSLAEPGVHQWQEQMEKVHELLLEGKWKPALRRAGKLAADVCATSWHGRELKQVLAELAFFRAAAAANLGQPDEAVWSWHMAQNLDPRIGGRDLAPYGEAGELLREFPLRRPGTAPPRFRLVPHDYGKYTGAELESWVPTLFSNPGAARERPGDVYVELIVDREGRVHHPVVLTGGVNPVLAFDILESMRAMPRLEPARYSDEPVDSLFKYRVTPDVSRWVEGGKKFTGELQ